MNKNVFKRPEVLVGLIVVAVLIIAAIYILSPQNNTTVSTNIVTQNDPLIADNKSPGQQAQILPVEDNKVIKVGDVKITFAENFFVNTIVQAKQISNIQCNMANDGCLINFVTDGTTTYYISSPKEPIAVDGYDRSGDKIKMLNDSEFSYAFLTKVEDGPEAKPVQSNTISQIYGCIKNTICVGSGSLEVLDDTVNAKQVSDFENFVRSIQLN